MSFQNIDMYNRLLLLDNLRCLCLHLGFNNHRLTHRSTTTTTTSQLLDMAMGSPRRRLQHLSEHRMAAPCLLSPAVPSTVQHGTWSRTPPRNVDPFNGTTSTYRTWNARVKEHVMGKQPGWMRVIQLIETEAKPFTTEMIRGFDEIDGKPVDCAWLSNHFWSLICSNVTNDVFTHRVAFAGG